MPVVEH
ncbi:unnamed protein product, partial [Cuscuta europaea]